MMAALHVYLFARRIQRFDMDHGRSARLRANFEQLNARKRPR